ncbi:hypothetical protein Nepgr_001971 [Nepenthes gracilis]|uniref:Uncharacterized protein n=1 Tax=Nepenthes gracilis TaxID=150966 RepID=A0AAD3P698_NEPGR|nr:hypothetical protein Nepgr_001971 [Nepenthes gracilis]
MLFPILSGIVASVPLIQNYPKKNQSSCCPDRKSKHSQEEPSIFDPILQKPPHARKRSSIENWKAGDGGSGIKCLPL